MPEEKNKKELIIQAAKKIFQEKGYSGARTRDIAKEAGINISLLNYYFRSKENLFDIVMAESFNELVSFVRERGNDEKTSLKTKIKEIVEIYLEQLKKNPNLPIFIFNEIHNNPEKFINRIRKFEDFERFKSSGFIPKIYLFKQISVQLKEKSIDISPLHIFINILSMVIFPFISANVFFPPTGENNFIQFIEERKKLIPLWIDNMLGIK